MVQSDAVASQDHVRHSDGRSGSAVDESVLDVAAVGEELISPVGWRQIEIGELAPRVEIPAVGLDSVRRTGRSAKVGPIEGGGRAEISGSVETADDLRLEGDELVIIRGRRQLGEVKVAGTAVGSVSETEARDAVGGRNGGRVEFLVDANVRRWFHHHDAVRHGKSGSFGVDGFATEGALVDDLGIAASEDTVAGLGCHGALGRHVTPVEPPDHFRRGHAHRRAIDGDCRADVDHNHGRRRDQDRRFGCKVFNR